MELSEQIRSFIDAHNVLGAIQRFCLRRQQAEGTMEAGDEWLSDCGQLARPPSIGPQIGFRGVADARGRPL